MVIKIADRLIESPTRPTYHEAEGPSMVDQRTGTRPYFGSIPDLSQTAAGYAIAGVAAAGPAAEAGLQAGDRIVGLDDLTIGNLDDFDKGLRKLKAGDKVKVTVERDGERKEFEVELGDPR